MQLENIKIGITNHEANREMAMPRLQHMPCHNVKSIFNTHHAEAHSPSNIWLSHADVAQAVAPTSSISKQQVEGIVKLEFDFISPAKLISFVKVSEENLKFLTQSNGAASRLADVFTKSDEIRVCKMIVEVLDLISLEICTIEKLKDLFFKIVDRKKYLSTFTTVLRKKKHRIEGEIRQYPEVVEFWDYGFNIIGEEDGEGVIFKRKTRRNEIKNMKRTFCIELNTVVGQGWGECMNPKFIHQLHMRPSLVTNICLEY